MHETQTIVTDVSGVGQSVTQLNFVIGSDACSVRRVPCTGSFDAAFVKCLWPLVNIRVIRQQKLWAMNITGLLRYSDDTNQVQ